MSDSKNKLAAVARPAALMNPGRLVFGHPHGPFRRIIDLSGALEIDKGRQKTISVNGPPNKSIVGSHRLAWTRCDSIDMHFWAWKSAMRNRWSLPSSGNTESWALVMNMSSKSIYPRVFRTGTVQVTDPSRCEDFREVVELPPGFIAHQNVVWSFFHCSNAL